VRYSPAACQRIVKRLPLPRGVRCQLLRSWSQFALSEPLRTGHSHERRIAGSRGMRSDIALCMCRQNASAMNEHGPAGPCNLEGKMLALGQDDNQGIKGGRRFGIVTFSRFTRDKIEE